MDLRELERSINLLSTYTENPRNWERVVSKSYRADKKYNHLTYKHKNGSEAISYIVNEVKNLINGFRDTRYVELGDSGWIDGLKYAQNLVGSKVYRVWTVNGKKIVIPVRVLGIELNDKEVYLKVYSESNTSGKNLIRKLLLTEYHKTWDCHKESLEKLVDHKWGCI